uniref:DUF7576 family protein n=1 Tax=Halorussus halophilus TaxID=2650975 RepID=UPI0017888288|nr:hypothetical protein [Halorussus halophilus]
MTNDDRCTNCGDEIDTSQWYPVVTRTVDSEVQLYSFCDEDCRDDWTPDSP